MVTRTVFEESCVVLNNVLFTVEGTVAMRTFFVYGTFDLISRVILTVSERFQLKSF